MPKHRASAGHEGLQDISRSTHTLLSLWGLQRQCPQPAILRKQSALQFPGPYGSGRQQLSSDPACVFERHVEYHHVFERGEQINPPDYEPADPAPDPDELPTKNAASRLDFSGRHCQTSCWSGVPPHAAHAPGGLARTAPRIAVAFRCQQRDRRTRATWRGHIGWGKMKYARLRRKNAWTS